MADILQDCSTKDLERLQPITNRLMLAFQAMQIEVTKDLDIRDQMIVVCASLEQLSKIADQTSKKMTTPRFVRSIRAAVTVARSLGAGLRRDSI